MTSDASRKNASDSLNIKSIADAIARVQKPDGEIPWQKNDKTDPWDHVEAAMGLSIGGYTEKSRKALSWLTGNQNHDGSWYAAYRNGKVEDRTKDANMTSYIAVGVWHHYLMTSETGFLKQMWETVRRAIDFSLGLQAETGEIYWAISPEGITDKMALLTGSSSIFMSLKCALAIGEVLGHKKPEWVQSAVKLKHALSQCPWLFNVTKSRYSMDWFYPVLCGAVTGEAAQIRIEKYWKKFVMEGHGVRCVSDRPWVTIAETCELVLALVRTGNRLLAEIVFGWIIDRRYDNGSFWCGFTSPDMVVWPKHCYTWTDAVVLMAADALYDLTPASGLFCHDPVRIDSSSSV